MKAPVAKIPDYLKVFRSMNSRSLDLFEKVMSHGFNGVNPHELVSLRKTRVVQSDGQGRLSVNQIAKRQYYIFLQERESWKSNKY